MARGRQTTTEPVESDDQNTEEIKVETISAPAQEIIAKKCYVVCKGQKIMSNGQILEEGAIVETIDPEWIGLGIVSIKIIEG